MHGGKVRCNSHCIVLGAMQPTGKLAHQWRKVTVPEQFPGNCPDIQHVSRQGFVWITFCPKPKDGQLLVQFPHLLTQSVSSIPIFPADSRIQPLMIAVFTMEIIYPLSNTLFFLSNPSTRHILTSHMSHILYASPCFPKFLIFPASRQKRALYFYRALNPLAAGGHRLRTGPIALRRRLSTVLPKFS
jgi:hypothetical protein